MTASTGTSVSSPEAGYGRDKTRRRIRYRRKRAALLGADIAAIATAGVLATVIRFGPLGLDETFTTEWVSAEYWQLALFLLPLWVAALAVEGLYSVDRLSGGLADAGRVVRGLALGLVGLIVVTYALKMPGLSRAWTLLAWVIAVALVVLARVVIDLAETRMRARGRLVERALIVGSNAEAEQIIRILGSSLTAGVVPIGCLASSYAERLGLDFCGEHVPILGAARDLKTVIAEHDVDSVIIASSAFDHDVLARMVAELRTSDVEVDVSSGLLQVMPRRVHVREVGGVPLVSVRGLSLSRINLLTKRIFDLAVATTIILVGLPVFAGIAVAIKLTSQGPVFYQQERVGREGRRFGMYKFRSMVADADARIAQLTEVNQATGPLFKMKDDPRVTPIGRWMRKFSVDELPQLINVLKGEMSLVGPRPPLPREVGEYSVYHWRRLEVVPGMTGLWQVSGRSKLTFEEMVRLDVFYIENWSVSLDMSLLARTIPAVVLARGAY